MRAVYLHGCLVVALAGMGSIRSLTRSQAAPPPFAPLRLQVYAWKSGGLPASLRHQSLFSAHDEYYGGNAMRAPLTMRMLAEHSAPNASAVFAVHDHALAHSDGATSINGLMEYMLAGVRWTHV